jgi:serine/threonine-protein kinase
MTSLSLVRIRILKSERYSQQLRKFTQIAPGGLTNPPEMLVKGAFGAVSNEVSMNEKSAVPEKLGKYIIKSELGQGAMGIVYKGFDPFIERTVALKTIRKNLLDSAEVETILARFKQEAQAAGRLTHPNIVSVYEYGEDKDTAFIAMEFVEGRELKNIFAGNERFSLDKIVKIMSQLLNALAYSHRQGVIHRDIKHSNIILTNEGQVKVTDFGIARVESSNLTQTGMVIGTPGYMSPEQYMGQRIDGRSDIFSAGVILYQLITGEKPFPGQAMTTVMHKVLNVDPVNPSNLNYQIPSAFDAVVRKAIAKRPDERFQTAEEFSDAIHKAAEGISVAETEASDDDPTVIISSHKVAVEPSDGYPTAVTSSRAADKAVESSDDDPVAVKSSSAADKAVEASDDDPAVIASSRAVIKESTATEAAGDGDPHDAPTVVMKSGKVKKIARQSESENDKRMLQNKAESESEEDDDATTVVMKPRTATPQISKDKKTELAIDSQLKPKYAIVALLGIVLLISVGIWLWKFSGFFGEPVSEKESPVAVLFCTVEIATNPKAADIFVCKTDPAGEADLESLLAEGEFKGKTPLQLELEPGRHEFTLKKDGYDDFVVELEVEPGTHLPFEAEMVKSD